MPFDTQTICTHPPWIVASHSSYAHFFLFAISLTMNVGHHSRNSILVLEFAWNQNVWRPVMNANILTLRVHIATDCRFPPNSAKQPKWMKLIWCLTSHASPTLSYFNASNGYIMYVGMSCVCDVLCDVYNSHFRGRINDGQIKLHDILLFSTYHCCCSISQSFHVLLVKFGYSFFGLVMFSIVPWER